MAENMLATINNWKNTAMTKAREILSKWEGILGKNFVSGLQIGDRLLEGFGIDLGNPQSIDTSAFKKIASAGTLIGGGIYFVKNYKKWLYNLKHWKGLRFPR
jgi:hypothetical protein